MPNINLSILNQKQTPAFFADILANRPAPSFVGRVFISTDTLDLYRDTGTAWDLLSPSSTGTITGLGAAGQVTIFSGASSITGTNNLFWDTTNLRLGINNNTPGASLDVHSATGIVAQLNVTTATNNTELAFQNSGTGKWRIGNSYNAGANDFQVYDVVNSLQRFSVKNTGQTFVGTQTSSSGLLVVNSATGDNHIVAIGSNSPSLRINNSGTGATRLIGLGLATAVNNFIQGAAGGDMAIFNSSTTASNILFGIYDAGAGNTQEAARFSAARNFLVGTNTDGGQKLQINGTSRFTGFAFVNHSTASSYAAAIYNTNANGEGLAIRGGSTSSHSSLIVQNYDGSNSLFNVLANGNVGIGTTSPAYKLDVLGQSVIRSTSANGISFQAVASDNNNAMYLRPNYSGFNLISSNYLSSFPYLPLSLSARENSSDLCMSIAGNTLIGTTTDNGQKLQVSGTSFFSASSSGYAANITNINDSSEGLLIRSTDNDTTLYLLRLQSSVGATSQSWVDRFLVTKSGQVSMRNLPTSSVGLVSGDLWNNLGIVNIVP